MSLTARQATDRYGKKIETIRVQAHEDGPITTLDVRFNIRTGLFAVQVTDLEWVESTEIKTLKTEAKRILQATTKIEYKRYIEFSFEAYQKSSQFLSTDRRHSHEDVDLEDVAGFTLVYRVLELSDPIKRRRENQFGEETYRLGRVLHRSRDKSELVPLRPNEPPKAIDYREFLLPYTPEVEQGLDKILLGLRTLYEHLRRVLAGDELETTIKLLTKAATTPLPSADLPALPARKAQR